MSIYDKDLISGRTKIETAIERIRQFCNGKKVLVAFSGGKDSQCCYHLAKLSGIDFHAEYSITRFEPPELIDFIRKNYPDVTFRREYKHSLYEDIKHWGLPNRFYRWCCDAKHKKTDGYDIAIIGIRWAESARRKMRWNMFGQKQDKTYYVCPICDWSDGDVWEFLNSNHLPHCSLYDDGYNRIGCICCPLSPKYNDALRWPKTAAMLRNAFYAHYDSKRNNGFVNKAGRVIQYLKDTPKETLFDNWLRYGMHVPPTEIKGDDAPCLFAGTGFSESDSIENNEEEGK